MNHVVADRVLSVRQTMFVGYDEGTPRTQQLSVAIIVTTSGNYFSVRNQRHAYAVLRPDTVTLIHRGGLTPAGNSVVIHSEISRADYDALVKVAEQRYPYPLRLTTKEETE